jgi:vanillate/3-O-methylgallate O-demethylase
MSKGQSLEDKLRICGNPVEMLRNSPVGKYVHAGVQSEFSNWQDEQRSWRETAALFDQSHHMTEVYFEGPDVIRLLSDVGVNSFRTFAVNKAKQFVCCNYDGYVIGDAILFYLDEHKVSLVGRAPAMNWLQFHAETGGYDVRVERDERTAINPAGRRNFRYQVQGPNAMKILAKLNGAPLPDLKFFNIGEMHVAGHRVRTLHHGMSGVPGLELFGPSAQSEEVKAAIVEAGREYGLRPVGSRAYATNTLESGWIPCPVPAVYSGEKMKAYREWLPAAWYEGSAASLGGSFYSRDITDYYTTPYDLGYGPFVKFDHDFIGREALERMADKPRRKKVTLAWNGEDVARAFASLFRDGDGAKFIDLPQCSYSSLPNDRIMKDGRMVGVSTFAGYSYNERSMLSLSVIDIAYSEPGTEVVLVWGEEAGGTSKPTVERHVQTEIRAIVSPAPYSRVAREEYAQGWRTGTR